MGVGLVAASHFAVVWFITANNGATEIVEFITRKIAVIDILKNQHCQVSPCVDVRVFLSVARVCKPAVAVVKLALERLLT